MESAELYSTANGMQKRDAKKILEEFGDKIKWGKESRILDIGCGTGDVTTEILLPRVPKDFKELIGLDMSLEVIQHARNLHSHQKVSFFQFDLTQNSEHLLEDLIKIVSTSRAGQENQKKIQNPLIRAKNSPGDCLLLNTQEIKPQGFEVIFSFYCLHWISDQRLAIRNIYKLLKPGGESLIVFLVKSPIFTLYRKLSTIELWKEYMKDVDNFIPCYQDSENPVKSFTEILNDPGFQTLSVDCREENYTFESFSSLRNAIVAVNPFLTRMPNHLQEEFINECLRQTEFLQLAEFKNNSYKVCYKLMVAHIRKPLNCK